MRQLTDSTGAVQLAQNYEPYGSVLGSYGETTSNYGFAGEWTDGTGLQHLRARYLNTGIGRFISRDTWAGDYNRPMSLNRWMYVEGNPVMRVDPSGLSYISGLSSINFNPISASGFVQPVQMIPSLGINLADLCNVGDTGNTSTNKNTKTSKPFTVNLYAPISSTEMRKLYDAYRDQPGWWNSYTSGTFTIETFLGLMLAHEVHNHIEAMPLYLEAAARQLWTDASDIKYGRSAGYCTYGKYCFNGVLNFLGTYVESARRRYWNILWNCETQPDRSLVCYGRRPEPAAINVDKPTMMQDMVVKDGDRWININEGFLESMGYTAMHPQTGHPEWQVFDPNGAYDWGNLSGPNGGQCPAQSAPVGDGKKEVLYKGHPADRVFVLSLEQYKYWILEKGCKASL